MSRIAQILATAALALTVAVPAAAKSEQVERGDADTYLFDLLKKPAYRKVWRSQIVPHTPKKHGYWIKNANGPTAPEEPVSVEGRRYLASTLCEPHNCISNTLYILINKQRAVVLYRERQAVEGTTDFRYSDHYYGKPTAAEKEALQKLVPADE
ncbi:Inhibitor of vertebrate lysozyme precursor [Kingella potus]|uniref:Inhibitor of vertebrate lysozyme n=1 Tax=Kingella potus TaxID=265175 RepID=A0A377R537_9NEIS|nr:Ivy family c-type lysozyme inhibitor [Kingella potus]UOP00279.1 inhibitor of vertebrate lysozyme family protein [Kingella potus]STR02655.1 Inhibitor of vertebrate lysozyme precursor [Kingella potus]